MRIRGHILSKQVLMNGMPVTSAVAKTLIRAFFAILSFISFLISVRPTFVRQLKTSHLLAPIKKVDASGKHDVAQRLQQRVTAIMRYAVQNDYIDSNPTSDMAGALSTTKARHYPALPSSRFPEFLARLAAYRGRVITRIAVELSLLTFVRSSELRFARWDEFDFDKSLWRIPAKREEIKDVCYSYRGMKMKEEHIVTLSRQAMAL